MEAIASNTYLTRLSPPFKNLICDKEGLLKRNPSSAGGQFEFTLTRMAQEALQRYPADFCLIRPPMPSLLFPLDGQRAIFYGRTPAGNFLAVMGKLQGCGHQIPC
jgi:hypothetical protein